jgi:hypothetical protein
VKLVGWRSFQLRNEVHVEITSLVGFGVDENTPTADLGTQFDGTSKDVSKKPRPEPASFVLAIHTQPGEQRYRLGVSTDALSETCWRISRCDARHAPRVVRNDLAAAWLSDNHNLGRSRGVRLASMLS